MGRENWNGRAPRLKPKPKKSKFPFKWRFRLRIASKYKAFLLQILCKKTGARL